LARISFIATGGPLPGCLSAALLLAGCGPSDTDPGAGGVTVGEARALDEAAEMLDQQRLPEEALPPPAEANETPAPADQPPEPADRD
jgi:hypothetical protein